MTHRYIKQNNVEIGYLNIYHLPQKVPDLCVLLNKPESFSIFGVSETRLKPHTPDSAINIPNFSIIRRDPVSRGETGIAVYIHNSLQNVVNRRQDLETQEIECVWLELKTSKSPTLFICFLYRNPAATFEWYDNFLHMCETVCARNADVLLMGDFNIDLFKPHHAWDCTANLLGLHQLISFPTRVTATTSTLLDHIYTNKPTAISNVKVGSLTVSDHFPISCAWTVKLPKVNKPGHTYTTYRSFKHFNEQHFMSDLSNAPFAKVYKETDPECALSVWYDILISIFNKHAPLRRRRVKQTVFPLWLTQEIINAMDVRDELRREKRFAEFKQERKRVKLLVRQAKKSLVDRLISQNKDTASLWRAMTVVTGGADKQSASIPSSITADDFNQHFLSVAESLAPSDEKYQEFNCSDNLINFCESRLTDFQSHQLQFMRLAA